jgi:hypothetical protein
VVVVLADVEEIVLVIVALELEPADPTALMVTIPLEGIVTEIALPETVTDVVFMLWVLSVKTADADMGVKLEKLIVGF